MTIEVVDDVVNVLTIEVGVVNEMIIEVDVEVVNELTIEVGEKCTKGVIANVDV